MSNKGNKTQNHRMVHYSILHHGFEFSDAFLMKVLCDNEEKQACDIIAELYATEEENKQVITTGLLKNGTATIFGMTIYDVRIEDQTTITIFVKGGLIQDIQGIPEHIRIQVQDYDIVTLTSTVALTSTDHDSEGTPCIVSIWESEG